MLDRLSYMQPALGLQELDELNGSLLRKLTATQLVLDKYIQAYGVLDEFKPPAPPEAPSDEAPEETPEPEG